MRLAFRTNANNHARNNRNAGTAPHALDEQSVFEKSETSAIGLAQEQAQGRLREFSPNRTSRQAAKIGVGGFSSTVY
jgi:hypothetical protein